MIRLTRLNNEAFLVNCDLIEYVEETPHTVISMMSGRRLVVSETSDEVRRRVIEYKRQLYRDGPIELPES